MHTLRAVALIALVTFTSALARAQALPTVPLTAVPPGEDVVVVAKKGEPAPFTGQLFDDASAMRWAHYLQQCKFRLVADVAYQKKYDDTELGLAQQRLVLADAKYSSTVSDLQARLTVMEDQVASPPFYKTMWFGMVVGGLLAAGAVGLAAYSLSALK